MSDEQVTLEGPHFKDTEHYLNPYDWYGETVPHGKIGAYGLGHTCWWWKMEWADGRRKAFAAETPEIALAAAKGYARGRQLTIREIRDPEQL